MSNDRTNNANRANNINKVNSLEIEAKFLIGCDGARSKVKKALNFGLKGDFGINFIYNYITLILHIINFSGIQNFINVHFTSQELSDKLKSINQSGMLHFIFNPNIVCVLISYCLINGVFALQIPYYPPIQSLSDYNNDKCLDIIKAILKSDHTYTLKDIVN